MPGDITSEFTHGEFDRAPDPLPVGNITAPGFSDVGARGDHQHKYGRQYGGTVTRVSPLPVGSSVVTLISWEVRTRDPENFLVGTLPLTDLKTPVGCAGRYLVSLSLWGNIGGSSVPRTFLQISGPGNQHIRYPFEYGSDGSASGIINVNDGDIMQASMYQTTGATISYTGLLDWVRLGPIT